MTGFEALIRWDHPEHGADQPGQFIPLAEEIGLIDEIGEWVLRDRLRRGGEVARQMSVAVNLSPVQFKAHALPATVRSALSDAGLAAKRLELEITEGVLLNNDEHVHDMIDNLKEIGVKLALDDFGTGYSSLSYLLRVPFDKIKIDQSFVRGASDPESRNAALIRAMVGLASDLHMQTTAEGVETPGRTAAGQRPRLLAGPGLYLRQANARPRRRCELAGRPTPSNPTASHAARAAYPHHPRRAAALSGAGHRRAASQHLERRRAGRMPRRTAGRGRRSSSTSPSAG